jgi:ribosomal protein L21E
MTYFEEGELVRVDIPDETDPDHNQFHGEHGTVVEIIQDDVGAVTGDDRDSVLYRVELDGGETIDLRWRDLRPPIE